jgi:hypothetical protein
LMPMIWIGEIWRLGVIVIFLSVLFGGPLIFLPILSSRFENEAG